MVLRSVHDQPQTPQTQLALKGLPHIAIHAADNQDDDIYTDVCRYLKTANRDGSVLQIR